MRRGQAPAAALAMTELQYGVLEQESRRRTIAHQFSSRINLLLRASQGQSNSQIARDLAISLNTVKSWRRRWQDSYAQLCAYEASMPQQGLSKRDYLQVLLEKLRDLPRSGTRKRITLQEEQQLVALASEAPQEYGVEMSCWTHEMLAKVAMARGIVKQVCGRHVGNILKKTSYSPTNLSTGCFPKSKTGKPSLPR